MRKPFIFQPVQRFAVGLAIALVLAATGCTDRGFMRGLLSGQLFNDDEDIGRRAQFDGYADRVDAYEGSQAAGH